MKITVEVDEDVILDTLMKAREIIFECIFDVMKSEVYPRQHHMQDLSDNMKYLNATNTMIEYFGGEQADLPELFEMYEVSRFRVPLRD